MKNKLIIVALFATSSIAINPVMAATRSNTGLIARAKKEYKEFKSAFSCVRKSGFRACSTAQKKRIVAAGVAVVATALALSGGGLFAWKLRQKHLGLKEEREELKLERLGLEREARKRLQDKFRPHITAEKINKGGLIFTAITKDDVDLVKDLLLVGANAKVKNEYDGSTPLHMAAFKGNLEVVNVLLRAGADKDVKDKYGRAPLYMAAFKGNPEVVNVLLGAGANKDVKDEDGSTPLHMAAFKDNLKVVTALLDARADKDVKNSFGSTPLDIAIDKNNQEIITLLEKHGAKKGSEL